MNLNASVPHRQHGSRKCQTHVGPQGRTAALSDGMPRVTFAKSARAPWHSPVGENNLSFYFSLQGEKNAASLLDLPATSPGWSEDVARTPPIQVWAHSRGLC